MFKKAICLALLLSLALSTAALAEVTNRDMQLAGGLAVSNETDTFFFCPMEPGITKHWGLYKLSTAKDGPIVEIKDGFPARLVHADNDEVFFLGYTDAGRTSHALYSVKIADGTPKKLVENISAAFVGESDTQFYYVKQDDLFTLYSYSIKKGESTKIKDMSGSKKTIYDASVYKDVLYFLTKSEVGAEDGYKYNETSKKATNLDKPKGLYTSLLYEGFQLYARDANGLDVYAVKIGGKSGVPLSQEHMVSLSNPRYGDTVFAYDGDNNTLIGIPLDGSAKRTLALEGKPITMFVLGGTQDELFLYENGGVYSVRYDLSSQTRLFDVDGVIGNHMWTNILPAKNNAILVMGYGPESLSNRANMMPSGVYAFDRNSGELLFGYPAYDPAADDADEPTMPEAFGDIPQEEPEDGETYFTF